MTTPERLRRRQRMNDVGIALLAGLLVLAFLYFQGQSDAQKKCLANYISANSQTSAVRSDQVERESKATRAIILKGTAARSREEFEKARAEYVRTLRSIDAARAANPVQTLPKGVCD